jgi:hypothetical protein
MIRGFLNNFNIFSEKKIAVFVDFNKKYLLKNQFQFYILVFY